ncbi:uracil-DNA glycosylase [Microbacteriaceae bacterium]|nr:uracil-DNA glycosylase [Candidatus Saccharibacteria bacterium]
MNKHEAMEALKEDILVNDVCPELRASAIQLVMGDGSLDADIIFVGEAPGRKEDETGLPFVGASGKFLDELLELAGMKRADVYITSIVKYRPPNNRDPKPDEKQAFLPYLLKQIEIIQPKAIVPLGRHGMEYFLPNEKIGVVHGMATKTTINNREVLVIPVYHPAAALYNRSLRQTLIDDFIKIPSLVAQA